MAIRRKSSKKKATRKARKDPQGGLTSEGRNYFRRTEGANLKPGVKGAADTPLKMKRKGSFLRRHYATLRGPLLDDDGKPTRLALAAHAWGEPVPKTRAAAARLAAKGKRLLDRYERSKSGGATKRKHSTGRKALKRSTKTKAR